jgi:hypothetical protein
VKSVPEILVSEGVFSTHEQEFYRPQSVIYPRKAPGLQESAEYEVTFVDSDDLPAQLRVDHG